MMNLGKHLFGIKMYYEKGRVCGQDENIGSRSIMERGAQGWCWKVLHYKV